MEIKDKRSIGKCLFCGKEFEQAILKDGSFSRRKFCSKECDVAYWKTQSKDIYGWGTCEQCGQKFKLEKKLSGRGYKQKKFCSIECEALRHKETSAAFHEQKGDKFGICLECGKKFEQAWIGNQYSKSSFCSEECRAAYADKKYPNRVKYCRFCGKRVPLKFSTIKKGRYDISDYCSDECREAFARETNGKALCLHCGKLFYREAFIDPRGHRDYKKGFRYKYCPDCRKNIPARTSQVEQEFYERMLKEGINCDVQEYNINHYYYDFKVTNFNILIDLNPSFTHCIEENYLNQGKAMDYHYRRAETAAGMEFFYICVWDWSDLDKVVALIKQLVENSTSKTTYTIKSHEPQRKLFYKEGESTPILNGIQKPDESYYTIYDCGTYSYAGYEDIILS